MENIRSSAEAVGYVLKEEQESAILSILNGVDTIVNLPVGYRKSIIFMLMPSK